MVSCVIVNCKNSSGKLSKDKDGITFHRFPRDKSRKKKWEVAVNREEGWSSTSSSAVCSDHFVANDFYLTESGLRRLSLNALPSINISVCQEPQPTICVLKPVNIMPDDSEEVIKLKYKVRRLEAIAEMRKKRLNVMWRGKKRLRKKLAQMKCLIKHLIKNERYKAKQNCSLQSS